MNREQIGALLLRMQESFLVTPDMTLSLREAERRFGFDAETCQAILTALVDAGVLMKLASGRYMRMLPHSGASRVRPIAMGATAA